ncbi:MAG TPA: histone deacetylase family protein [Candidatus Handelsmanbacteria bacterium]|nr:histone deacetylase family protein [Candidatus Handelsmanbacteria bacterium]
MKVFYSPEHQAHDPENEFTNAGAIPYPECARRATGIAAALSSNPSFEIEMPEMIAPIALEAIHDTGYLHFLAQVYAGQKSHTVELTPTTFPSRGRGRRPTTLKAQAGYYAFDTTPLTPGTWDAALSAAGSALTGADCLLEGARSAYALCRPPGHHAGRDYFGGYCYLNNAALSAEKLAAHGRVALLDIDYHHGNGTQDIFYDSDQVFFVSIHADPAYQYPLYWGYADERGEGTGEGTTRNFPLPPNTGDKAYIETLDEALHCIEDFAPEYLIVSAGLDICREDPLGDWAITAEGVAQIGARIATAGVPTLLVQEGGYDLRGLGANVRQLLTAFI